MRPSTMATVLEHAEAVFSEASAKPAGSESLAAKVWSALDRQAEHLPGTPTLVPTALPVCSLLDVALSTAMEHGGGISELAQAFGELASQLSWERRRHSEHGPEGFFDGHANAWLTGPRGLENRDDVAVGVTLMAPGVQYPDHQHPPEEFYVVLSPGRWRQSDRPWYEPGLGGVVYHPPGVTHAMRASESPLLALWFLWTGD